MADIRQMHLRLIPGRLKAGRQTREELEDAAIAWRDIWWAGGSAISLFHACRRLANAIQAIERDSCLVSEKAHDP